MLSQRFPKREHLCLTRDIDALFAHPDGTATAWPVRCIWRQTESTEPTQVLMSVAKRHLHHAVDRNRAKRQLRESYRLSKPEFSDTLLPGLHIAFVWMAPTPQSSDKVRQSVFRLLSKIRTQTPQA